jgi:hypothetical protein
MEVLCVVTLKRRRTKKGVPVAIFILDRKTSTFDFSSNGLWVCQNTEIKLLGEKETRKAISTSFKMDEGYDNFFERVKDLCRR